MTMVSVLWKCGVACVGVYGGRRAASCSVSHWPATWRHAAGVGGQGVRQCDFAGYGRKMKQGFWFPCFSVRAYQPRANEQ